MNSKSHEVKSMKKIVSVVAVGLSLILLLGSLAHQPEIYDPNSKSDGWRPCSVSRERIAKYEVIVASDSGMLVKKVTKRLDEKSNWIPIGGISSENNKFYQAMVMVKD